MYLLKLHLQDATGEVDAALFDKDADEFFHVSSLRATVTVLHSHTATVGQCTAT